MPTIRWTLDQKSTTSPHGGPVDSLANNIATFTISLSNHYGSGRMMWQKLSNALTHQKSSPSAFLILLRPSTPFLCMPLLL